MFTSCLVLFSSEDLCYVLKLSFELCGIKIVIYRKYKFYKHFIFYFYKYMFMCIWKGKFLTEVITVEFRYLDRNKVVCQGSVISLYDTKCCMLGAISSAKRQTIARCNDFAWRLFVMGHFVEMIFVFTVDSVMH